MSEMFKNYPQPEDYIPNNRHSIVIKEQLTIMAGESTSHSFEVPFDVDEQMSDYAVIYKLGLDVVVEKDKSQLSYVYDEDHNESIITCLLTPEETALFKNTLLSAAAQIKFITKEDGKVSYSEICPIILMDSLEI